MGHVFLLTCATGDAWDKSQQLGGLQHEASNGMMAKFLKPLRLDAYTVGKNSEGWALILGLSYGVIEYFLISSSPFSPIFVASPSEYFYRLIYIAALFLPFASRNYWRWFACGTSAMVVEDASYWAFDYWKTGALPVQWAWYYPVWSNIPLLYFIIPLVFYSYWRGKGWGRETK